MKFFNNILILFIAIANAMSPDERRQMASDSEQADQAIDFVSFENIAPMVQDNHIVMLLFGAKWCINTMKATPKFLEVQKLVKTDSIFSKGIF